MKVLNIEKGIIEVPDRFTPDEEAYIEILKQNKKFTVGHHHFAGYCLKCSRPILTRDVSYLVNKDGKGNIAVEAFHRLCNR